MHLCRIIDLRVNFAVHFLHAAPWLHNLQEHFPCFQAYTKDRCSRLICDLKFNKSNRCTHVVNNQLIQKSNNCLGVSRLVLTLGDQLAASRAPREGKVPAVLWPLWPSNQPLETLRKKCCCPPLTPLSLPSGHGQTEKQVKYSTSAPR